jgi:hypothetical protein
MSTFIVLPNGDAVSNAVIKSVQYKAGRGVACLDSQMRMVFWVPISDLEKGPRVRDILIKFMTEKHGISQPDWSFINDPEILLLSS